MRALELLTVSLAAVDGFARLGIHLENPCRQPEDDGDTNGHSLLAEAKQDPEGGVQRGEAL